MDSIHMTNGTEYRLEPNGEVVQFKSNITLYKEQKEAEDKENAQKAKREAEEAREKKKADELASLTHHTDSWGHPYSQKGTKKITAVYDEIWNLDGSTQQRKEWNDQVAILTMSTKRWITTFLGRLEDDAPTHSLFTCHAYEDHDVIHLFPKPFMVRVEKTKSGKYRENDTKKLRLDKKFNLEHFPKA